MNALLPGEPLNEGPDRMTAGRDRPPAVEILSAEKVFANGTRALAPIDLNIADGEFLTLIGPSGCGKSTLLKLIANLIEPSDGRLLWWRGEFGQVGQDGRRFAFVFQEPTLMPWARVDANVRLPLELANSANAKTAPAVAEAIERVGLSRFNPSERLTNLPGTSWTPIWSGYGGNASSPRCSSRTRSMRRSFCRPGSSSWRQIPAASSGQ